MRHRRKGKILSRKKDPRKALMRSLAIGLITHEKILTTEAKAKALRPFIEKMVTLSRRDTDKSLAARRRLLSVLSNRQAVSKLMSDIGPRYKSRKSGYTRIIKLSERAGDGARTAQIEFVK